MTHFSTFGPLIIGRNFKFLMLILTEECYCMHDRLPPKGMCFASYDLFKFWEISDDVSEMVQDRDIVATEEY